VNGERGGLSFRKAEEETPRRERRERGSDAVAGPACGHGAVCKF
jgi:hypothetical protein